MPDPIRTAQMGGATPSYTNANLEPVLDEFDMYWAGHVHYYNRFAGPIWKSKILANGSTIHGAPCSFFSIIKML